MKKRILIVEDDIALKPFWEHVLFRHYLNFQIDWCIDCESAVDAYLSSQASSFSYDLIVLDLFLSGSDTGLDFVSFLDCQFEKCPILLTSSVDQNRLMPIAKHQNLKIEVLTKPLNIHRLDNLICFRKYPILEAHHEK